MPLRYDPLLLRGLARELRDRRRGERVRAVSLDRERRTAELRFAAGRALLFLLHPESGAVLDRDGAGSWGRETTFRRLFLGDVRVPDDERLLFLDLVDARDRPRHRVAVELHTNQWNLLLLDARPEGPEPIRAALWPRETRHRALRSGREYVPPAGRREGAASPPAPDAWMRLLEPLPPEQRRGALLSGLAYTSSLNVAWILGRAAREAPGGESEEGAANSAEEARRAGEPSADAEEGDRAALREAYDRYLRIREAAGEASAGETEAWLLPRRWGPQPYPLSLDEPDARRLPDLLAGMAEAAGGEEELATLLPGGAGPGDGAGADGPATDVAPEAAEEAARLRQALRQRAERARRKRDALRRELETGTEPEELRAVGNLLLARLGEVPRGAETARLRDFDGSVREVELDPALEPAANAEAYFEEAGRRERARRKVPREIARSERSLREAEAALERLEEHGYEEGLWEAAGGRASAERGGDGGEEETLPYLRYRSSGGREIRVGRSARANDMLTFHHSSPEDIWLHARQVQGAHVILRWGRKEENPPGAELVEAALAAAVHSGARHSGTVAVDWTRRKYVRKPRKAPPGAVVPDRVRTVFVEPDENVLARMRADGG